MTRRESTRSALGIVLLVLAVPMQYGEADVKVPSIFSDHMVLQREMKVPVWGTAKPGEKVTVKFRDQVRAAAAGEDGKWKLSLDPLTVGGPDELVIRGANTVTIKDVLVGEVWVGSGQSNMAGGAGRYARQDEVLAKSIAAAPYPKLRLLKSGKAPRWQEATAENAGRFSALLFSFGLRLHQELAVPVGLMVGAVGGTPSGRWLPMEAIEADAACQAAIKKFAATHSEEALRKRYDARVSRWKKAAEAAKKAGKRVPRKPQAFQKPGDLANRGIGSLYGRFIRPLIPYGIRGVLWDQGEGGTRVRELDQYTLMGALIQGWRKEWGQGDFAFIYIQKPSGGGCAWGVADNPVTKVADRFTQLPPRPPKDGAYREIHSRIMTYPNTAMATSIDLGPGVHPINKSGYGARACRVALGMVYGKSVVICGPTYKSHEVEGNAIRIAFSHVGQGLAIRHADQLQGFAIAGKDRIFHWADAKIDGETVVVSSPKVAKPAAVRYGWSRRRAWANLFNKDGLPALSFRTDRW